MTTQLSVVQGARVQRAVSIVEGILHADELEAQRKAATERDVLAATKFAHEYRNNQAARDKYAVALSDIKAIITEATATPVSDGERLITMTTISMRKTAMHEALMSAGLVSDKLTLPGGKPVKQQIAEDITKACEGMDITAYIN